MIKAGEGEQINLIIVSRRHSLQVSSSTAKKNHNRLHLRLSKTAITKEKFFVGVSQNYDAYLWRWSRPPLCFCVSICEHERGQVRWKLSLFNVVRRLLCSLLQNGFASVSKYHLRNVSWRKRIEYVSKKRVGKTVAFGKYYLSGRQSLCQSYLVELFMNVRTCCADVVQFDAPDLPVYIALQWWEIRWNL